MIFFFKSKQDNAVGRGSVQSDTGWSGGDCGLIRLNDCRKIRRGNCNNIKYARALSHTYTQLTGSPTG